MFIMSDQNAPTETLSPSRQVMQFLWPGAMAAEAICVAAKLGIADLLGEDLKSASELARAVGAEAATLASLLAARQMPLMTIKAGECARVSVCRFGFVQVGFEVSHFLGGGKPGNWAAC
jgi:hypothetical protein